MVGVERSSLFLRAGLFQKFDDFLMTSLMRDLKWHFALEPWRIYFRARLQKQLN